MSDFRIVAVTHEQRYSTIDWALGTTADAICDAWDAACEPVTRRRCSTHDAEEFRGKGYCWAARLAMAACAPPARTECELTEEWCVPKPEVPS